MAYHLGIDLGGSHVAIGIVNEDGKILEHYEKDFTVEEKKNILPVVENYIAIEPSTCNIEIQVEEDDLHKLASIRAIKYRLTLGENTDPVDLTPEAALKIYIGVTGDVETTLNIEQLFNKDNTEE